MDKRMIMIALIMFGLSYLILTLPLFIFFPPILYFFLVSLLISIPLSILIRNRTVLTMTNIKYPDNNLINYITSVGFKINEKKDSDIIYKRRWWDSPFSNNVIIKKENGKYILTGDKWLIERINKNFSYPKP